MCGKLRLFCEILLIGISSWIVSASDEDGNRSINNDTAPTFESLLDRLRKPEGRLEGKGLTTDIFVANYLAMLKKGSDYPTAFTTANISAQCKQDSLNYYSAHKSFQLWALQSTYIAYNYLSIIYLICFIDFSVRIFWKTCRRTLWQ